MGNINICIINKHDMITKTSIFMKNFTIKFFAMILFGFFITSTISAQKIEVEKESRTSSDFTTTPFQDGNQMKGVSMELESFQEVVDEKYTEGDVTVSIPSIFNPTNEAFTIKGDAFILNMKIYNMLGELVYEGKANSSWQDNKAREGLYIYTFETRIVPNKTTKLKGYIRLKK